MRQGSNVYQKTNISTEVEITASNSIYHTLISVILLHIRLSLYVHGVVDQMRNRKADFYFRTFKGGSNSKLPQVFTVLISAAVCPLAWLNSSCIALAYSLLKHSSSR